MLAEKIDGVNTNIERTGGAIDRLQRLGQHGLGLYGAQGLGFRFYPKAPRTQLEGFGAQRHYESWFLGDFEPQG